MSQVKTSLSLMGEEDMKNFTKMMNFKPLWKDRTIQVKDQIANGICIEPFKTLSKYHRYMENPLLFLPDSNEFIYASGANLILQNFETNYQRIIPLKNDGEVTSISYHISPRNDKLLFVCEKIIADNDKRTDSDEEERFAGRVEIIFLKATDEEKIPNVVLETENLLRYSHYILGCKIKENSSYAYLILKSLDPNQNDSKHRKEDVIITWDYILKTIKSIEYIPEHFDNFILSPYKENQFLCYNKYKVGIYQLDYTKKYFKQIKEILTLPVDGEEKIKGAYFFDFGNEGINNGLTEEGGIAITFQNEWMEIYTVSKVIENKEEEVKEEVKENKEELNEEENNEEGLGEIKEEAKEDEPKEEIQKETPKEEIPKESLKEDNKIKKSKRDRRDYERCELEYTFFIRLNYFTYLVSNWIEIVNKTESESIRGESIINLIPFSKSAFVPTLAKDKVQMDSTKNYIAKIVPCKNFLIVFLNESNIILILEFLRDHLEKKTKLRISSIGQIEQKIVTGSSVIINDLMTKMIVESPNFKNPFISDDSPIPYVNMEVRSLFQYKINLIDNSPNFVYQRPLLENYFYGLPISHLRVSENPKVILCNIKDILYLYLQKQNEKEEDFGKSKFNENGNQNYIHAHTNFYKENNEFIFLSSKKIFEGNEEKSNNEKIKDIAISPLGRTVFVASKHKGILLSLIGNNLEEVMKINSKCKCCAFDDSGSYLAFSSEGEKEGENNINIFNLNTYEYDYIIIRVPTPSKLKFYDNSKILVALCEQTIFGFKLNWRSRLINCNTLITATPEELLEDPSYAFKLNLNSEYINDFIYDPSLDYTLLLSNSHKSIYYKQTRDNPFRKIEFYSDVQYKNCVLIKRFDSIVFGTENGCLRTCLFPFSTPTEESEIVHPDYNELALHCGEITSIVCSKDGCLLYSSGKDGSIYISCVTSITSDSPISLNSFMYFDQLNYLPCKIHYDFQEVSLISESVYLEKLDELRKEKDEIQKAISDYTSNKEKTIQEHTNDIADKKKHLEEQLKQAERHAKYLEGKHEEELKQMVTEKDKKEKENERDYEVIKAEKKEQKKKKQEAAKELEKQVKIANEKFNKAKNDLEEKKKKTNEEIQRNLETMYQNLLKKKEEIQQKILKKQEDFERKCEDTETEKEKEIKDKQEKHKAMLKEYEETQKELNTQLSKCKKENKNHNDKINEWENHLKELELNNQELMETYIFNILKLSQMNKLLAENEEKISTKEKIVKEKRAVNDRLEQLRFVLEYQINNLVQEKTPIEEQIKNFETLHADFYKRFNLLYTELLKITELIENNNKCIKKYREELSKTKKKLYEHKNLYKSIDVKLNSVIKSKLESKSELLERIQKIYTECLENFHGDKKEEKIESAESKLQTKNIEKEIFHQKNNVLRELIEKRSERKRINLEKEEMMKDIRLDNQLLIMECSNIRENLEDIMKNINDIEKKFIELTNNDKELEQNEEIKQIKRDIKSARESMLLNSTEIKNINKKSVVIPKTKLSKINKEIDKVNIPNPEELLRMQQKNSDMLGKEKEEVERMQNQLQELLEDEAIISGKDQDINKSQLSQKSGRSSVNKSQKLANINKSKNISIKSENYYDSQKGDLV
ncbi:MAG: hypothetical protein MJ252_02095 [archaeon]|nr:hypothetical protein [archaeon]